MSLRDELLKSLLCRHKYNWSIEKQLGEILAIIDKHNVGENDYTAIANNVKTVIELQRCEWTRNIAMGRRYDTGCGDWFDGKQEFVYCSSCGKRIEVKDAP
jgi:hypothetical protein